MKVPEIMRVSNSPSFLVSDLQEVYFMHDREHITDPEVLGRIRGIVGGQGAWLVYAGRCGCPRWVQLLGAGLAVVAVDAVALIWELVWMDFLTLRGDPGLYGHAA